ncbi:peptidoglycan editing factor PgeF [Sulfurospirillum arcachonense]|uniref:peptidoglycan editing factor PgeF n=1 Tax=Sulfurospirillum arcachonense TaxID=57666 RepID=UPI000469C043|nr:peptidoglycan editing factor PgeF [Sulfurospirillum arcachonense]
MYFFTDRFVGVDREKLQKKVGNKKLIFMNQIHSSNVKVVNKNSPSALEKTDAMITNDKDVALCVVVADCNPVIFLDESKGVVGVAHAGRVGSYEKIAQKTVLAMSEEFGCVKKDIHVKIGPSIKACCYEVGSEVIGGFETFTCKKNAKIFLDLIALNKQQLQEVGIEEKNIEISSTCTCCDENYFSYRREATKSRFCGVVSL